MEKLVIVILMLLNVGTGAFCGPTDLPLKTESGTYYIDVNSGNDSYPGTESQPFKTINHASTVLQPGDTVIINSGIYHETVMGGNSGLPGRPITYQGVDRDTVILRGSITATRWLKLGDIWYKSGFRPVTDNNIFILADDDSRLARVSSTGSIVPGSFFVDPNNTCWIRLKDDSNPNTGHTIDVYELNSSFNAYPEYGGTAKSYIVLRNMTIEKYGSFGIGAPYDQVAINTHWEIDNLKCQFNVVGLSYASDDWYIHDSQFSRNSALGCQIDGSRVRFINNICNNNNWGGGIIIGGNGHSNIVRGCNFNNNGDTGSHGYGSGIYLENQSHDNLIENNIINGNLHCGIGFYGGSNNTVINNIITNMSVNSWWKSTAAIVIGHSYLDDATQSVGNLIAYNTIWNCFIPLAILEPNRTIDPKEVNVFTNNAFLQYNKMFNKPKGLVARFNNNAYFNLWRVNEPNGIDKLDTHPISGVNPLLTSPQTNDFIPLSNSPLIDAGVTVSSITTDIRGISRPQGAYPDIGAYERTSTD